MDVRPNLDCSVVYFVQAATLGLVKIGLADDIRKRMSGLRSNSPDELHLMGLMPAPDGVLTERTVHDLFSAHRVRGEWFRPAPDLIEFWQANTPYEFTDIVDDFSPNTLSDDERIALADSGFAKLAATSGARLA